MDIVYLAGIGLLFVLIVSLAIGLETGCARLGSIK